MTTSVLAHALPTIFERMLPRSRDKHNPDFHLFPDDLRLELERMRASPVVPRRPVLVLAGYHAWSLSVAATARTLHGLVGGPQEHFHAMAYPLGTDIPTIARRVVREVSRRWPNPEPHRTTEIDVVAISMGGIVARVAASRAFVGLDAPRADERGWWQRGGGEEGQRGTNRFPSPPPLFPSSPLPRSTTADRHLQISRLFTLATPHRGAILAARVPGPLRPDRAARDLHPEAPFLARLNASLSSARYELVCYTRLRDSWVGARRTAPPGREPIWTPGPRLMGHITIGSDRLILADIARRLRGEDPIAGPRACSTPPCD